VLARGLGTRMRQGDAAAVLTDAQQQAADAGLKPLMPINGHPFLAYVLDTIANAGMSEVALVVAPDHDPIRAYLNATPPARLDVSCVVQPEARGTADAMLAVRAWVGDDAFVVMNADNLYPAATLRDLTALNEPGFPAFDADDLVASGNIPADRLRAFALVEMDDAGYVRSIVEKPTHAPSASSQKISMNLWRFDSRIFEACAEVPISPRGEFELPGAVALAVARGLRIRAIPARGPVLDLSRRADAADVERRLAGITPCP
jgi:glucose-1-phosphate thymidylyltransferase